MIQLDKDIEFYVVGNKEGQIASLKTFEYGEILMACRDPKHAIDLSRKIGKATKQDMGIYRIKVTLVPIDGDSLT